VSFLRKRCIAPNKVTHANQSFPKFQLARLVVSLPRGFSAFPPRKLWYPQKIIYRRIVVRFNYRCAC